MTAAPALAMRFTVVMGDLNLMTAPVDGNIQRAALMTAQEQEHRGDIVIECHWTRAVDSMEMSGGLNGEDILDAAR